MTSIRNEQNRGKGVNDRHGIELLQRIRTEKRNPK
jgi:hypothetical protein